MEEQQLVTAARLPDGAVRVRVAGHWRIAHGLALPAEVVRTIDGPPSATRLSFDATELRAWDSSLPVVVEQLVARCRLRAVPVDTSALPEGLRRLLALSEATPPQRPPPPPPRARPLVRLGTRAIDKWHEAARLLAFVGEVAFSLARLFTRRARVRSVDLLTEMQDAGARSLSIVAVVSFLMGVIIAFVATSTLQRFGAELYVADTVAIGMVREMGPIMTAVVMAGRSGSAYAAQIGTMKVTQEVDALTTMALPPSDFLVLPRVLALSLMMPLLTVYADFTAIGSGALLVLLNGQSAKQYLHEASTAIKLSMFWIALIKSFVFGVVVAVSGCMHGLRVNKGAAAVGDAATATVVTCIVWIIAIDGVFALILDVLKL
jgi:phospholipid/cholesterol/gamma-HCH transport system permease protein